MRSFLRVLVLVAFLFGTSVVGGGIKIDKDSCKKPLPDNSSIKLKDVQAILDEALLMASTTETAFAQAAGDPSSTNGKRVNYILQKMLALQTSSPTFPTLQKFFSQISTAKAGNLPFDITIYCNEDFLTKKSTFGSLFGKPPKQWGNPSCPSAENGFTGPDAYTTAGRWLVMCPNTWQKHSAPEQQVIGARRNQRPDPARDYMDQQLTLSGIMLHELLHAANWGTVKNVDGQDDTPVKDVKILDMGGMPMANKFVTGYQYAACRAIAAFDLSAQRQRPLTDAVGALPSVLRAFGSRVKNTYISANTPGMAFLNCDSLRLVALQIFLINTDFVGDGRARYYGLQGFFSPGNFRRR